MVTHLSVNVNYGFINSGNPLRPQDFIDWMHYA